MFYYMKVGFKGVYILRRFLNIASSMKTENVLRSEPPGLSFKLLKYAD